MSDTQKIVVTYTFVLDASVIKDDKVWNAIVKMEDERMQSNQGKSNILPLDVTELIECHGGDVADAHLTQLVVNAVNENSQWSEE
jgi:hypothetical protein